MRVLIFALDFQWTGIARLPRSLRAAGFEVACLCDPAAFLVRTRHLDRRYLLTAVRPGTQLLHELSAAIDDWQPALVVPGDDTAVRFLHRVARLDVAGDLAGISERTRVTLRRSLGDPAQHAASLAKLETQRAASALGIAVPAGHEVRDEAGALAFAEHSGWPVVLKRDYGSAGAGVRICRDRASLAGALRAWRGARGSTAGRSPWPVRFKRALRAVLERHGPLSWAHDEQPLGVQAYVDGVPAMYACSAHRGRVLAGFAALKVRVHPAEVGPATVVRILERPDMAAAAAALVRRFEFTGFASFDFMVERTGGRALLLECNPRPVPVSHLGAQLGADLCGALHAALSGSPAATTAGPVRPLTVTLFPQELLRDPVAPDLATDLHDVPHDDLELLTALEGLLRRGHDAVA